MTAVLLPGLAVVVGALLALGPVAWIGGAWIAARGALALGTVGAVLSLIALLGGAARNVIEVPIGLPGSGILFALDGLSAFFLLPLFLAGAAAGAAALDTAGDDDPVAPFLPVLLGAMAATVLAADGFSVVLAFEATALCAAALVLGGAHGFRGAPRIVGGGVVGGLALVAAMALLAPLQSWGLDLSFAGMRAQPPQGVSASAVLVLALIAGGGAAGLVPLHRWLPGAQATMPAPAGALLAGAGNGVGSYLLARVLFDLAGPAQPAWWGFVLVALGAAGAMLGAAQAVRADNIRAIPGTAAVANTGLVAVGLGVALTARAADLAPLAALALGAALLLAVADALPGTLLALAAGAAEAGAGTERLDRLGGLLRSMNFTTLCTLVAAASFAALPPSPGFAAAWTLLQALIGSARMGGLGWQTLVTLAVLATVIAMTLGAVAAVRLVGIGFLGRPRTPRAAAAREAALPARAAMLALAFMTLAAGVFPAGVLALAGPALKMLLGVGFSDDVGLLAVKPVAEAPGLEAAALAVLLVLATVATLRLLRVRASVGQHAGPAWEGGAAPPPPWLPFGDPATQIGPADFAEPLGAMLSAARPGTRRWVRPALRRWRRVSAWAADMLRPSARLALLALLAAAVLLLLAVMCWQAT
jgi:hydrogenase-4 component B